MGLTTTSQDNSSNNENLEIPEDYYHARFKEVNPYVSSRGDEKLAFIFEVVHNGETVEVGNFKSAKITSYSDELKEEADIQVSDSDLAQFLERTDLLNPVSAELHARLTAADWFNELETGDEAPQDFLISAEGGFKVDNDDEQHREKEHDLLAEVLDSQLSDRFFRIQVVTPEGDGGSLVEKIKSELEEEDVDPDFPVEEENDETSEEKVILNDGDGE